MGSSGAPPLRFERRRLLREVPLFASLDDAALDALLRVTGTRHLDDGQVLFRKGDAGRQLFGVIQGRLKIYASGSDGKEVVFGLAEPGEVIGEIALLDDQPRSATVVALASSELLVLDRREFRPFLERHPRVAIELAEVLAARLRRLSQLTEDSVLLPLRVRLAKRLLALAADYGRESPQGVVIDLKLSQQALGDMVGTTRESVNKQLRAWTREGVVHFARGVLTLCDPRRLETIQRLG